MALETDLESYWPLVANSIDVWGSHNGTDTNISYASGSAESDATGNRIDLGNPASLDFGTGDFSFTGWAYFDSIPAAGSGWIVIAKGLTSLDTPQYRGWWLSAFNGQMSFWTGGGGAYTQCGTVAVSTGQWYQVSGVRRGVTSELYIDGVLVATATSAIYDVTNPYVGTMLSAYNGSWYDTYSDGKIQDVAAWSRALTAVEVAAVYAAGRGNFGTLLPLEGKLESYWPLDTNSNDAWGSNNGTDSNMSYSSGAADFNGSSSLITVSHSAAWITTGFTLMAWVNPSGLVGTQRFLGKGRSSFNNWVSLSLVTSSLQALTWGASAGPGGDVSGGTISSSTWQHVAMTWDGTTLTAYINGVSLGTDTDATFPGLTNTNDFIMGRNPESAAEWFGGSLDDAAFWSRELTAVEVAAVHAAGLGNLGTLLPSSQLKGMFSSIVHSVAADDANLEGMFSSIVHSVAADDANLEGMWTTVVHTVPVTAAIVPNIAGAPLVPATFDGSGSTNISYYNWSWVSVPGGSSIVVGPAPFPDNGAVTPEYGAIMASNVALYHLNADANDTSGAALNLTLQNGPSFIAGQIGQALDFNGTNQEANVSGVDLLPGTTNAITVAFWQFGDASQPRGDVLLDAKDGGALVIKIYLPWSDSKVYFDCGGSSGYDRISKTATPAEFEGAWNHWAFTKDVVAGEMKIYLNGVLWHSGVGATKALSAVDEFAIGSAYGGYYYAGALDEVAIWARVLSAVEIANIYSLQAGLPLGTASTYTFTPDVAGTYTINLAVSASVNTNADAVITAPSAGGPTSQGEGLQGNVLQGWGTQGNT